MPMMSDAPQFLTDRPRVAVVDLEWPVSHAGVDYRRIELRRLSAGEVAAFMKRVAAAQETDPDAEVRFPIFYGEDGNLIPDEVMDALDDDDVATLTERAVSFLPRRFRGLGQEPESASIRPDGARIAPTSPA